MKKCFEILKWDSKFFGFKVCRIFNANYQLNNFKNILFSMNKEQIHLGYYSSQDIINPSVNIANLYDIKLVDKKTTYSKEVNYDGSLKKNNIVPYNKSTADNKLINLAIESGVYSRFNIDKKIPKDKFEDLYRLWIINSVNKKIAKEVLVYMNGNAMAGMVTLGEKNGMAVIGLIAVDAAYRGCGIGKALMNSAESWFAKNNYKMIEVVTQGKNEAACKLYERCGYKVKTSENFYHLWNNHHK